MAKTVHKIERLTTGQVRRVDRGVKDDPGLPL